MPNVLTESGATDAQKERFNEALVAAQIDPACVFRAVMGLIATGDLMQFAIAIVECLLARRTRELADILRCFWAFWLEVEANGLSFGAVVDLVECIASRPPSDPPPDGEIPPPSYRDVDRCK